MYPILVVDDEALNLTTLQRVLRKHYDIDTADDPRTAKNMIAAKEYAVLSVISACHTSPGSNC
jgi:CheY-like chemotaxis protein